MNIPLLQIYRIELMNHLLFLHGQEDSLLNPPSNIYSAFALSVTAPFRALTVYISIRKPEMYPVTTQPHAFAPTYQTTSHPY